MLDGTSYRNVSRRGSIVGGRDVVVAQADVGGWANARDGVEAMSGSENGVFVEEGASTHHLELASELLSAQDDCPGPGSLTSYSASNNSVGVIADATSFLRRGSWGLGSGLGCSGFWCGCWSDRVLKLASTAECEVESLEAAWSSDGCGEVSDEVKGDALANSLKNITALRIEDVAASSRFTFWSGACSSKLLVIVTVEVKSGAYVGVNAWSIIA